jgi:hypothetical protein
MATKFVTNLDINQNQILNGTFEVLASDPSSNNFEGRMIYNSTEDTIKVYTGLAWRKMLHAVQASGSYTDALTVSESNGTVSLQLNLADTDSAGLLSSTFWNDLNGATSDATASKLVKRDGNGNIKVADPTDAAHAATKGYVDAARSGLDVKQSVRAATTAALTIASGLENGDEVDGVTLATGDRVLVKNQSTASENGIYVVQASGAAVRATDFDSTAEVTAGAFTFVEEGTINADSGWVVTTDGTITVGTTGIAWAQFSGAGSIVAGDGLTKTGSTLNIGAGTGITVNADTVQISASYTGQSSITTLGTITTGTWTGTAIAVANGGTGATDAATARTNLGLAIGSDVQAYDAELAALAGLASASNKLPYFTGSGTASLTDLSSFGRTLIDDADAAAARTTLGVAIGSDVQAYNSTLAAVAGGTYTGDDSITTLGTITTGTWNGTTIAIANGGTASTTASGARGALAATSSSGLTTSTPTLARIAAQSCAASVTGVSTTTVVHNLGTSDVIVQVYEVGTGLTVIADVDRDNTNQVTVVINGTVTLGDYKIVVTG